MTPTYDRADVFQKHCSDALMAAVFAHSDINNMQAVSDKVWRVDFADHSILIPVKLIVEVACQKWALPVASR